MAIRSFERNKLFMTGNDFAVPSQLVFARVSQDEAVQCIKEARESWENGVNEELLSMIAESKRPFAIVRYVLSCCLCFFFECFFLQTHWDVQSISG